MAIRGVIFDYGMVLSNAQEPAAHQRLLEITGLERRVFEDHYWKYRHAYDEGHMNGVDYWRKIEGDTGIALTAEQVEALIEQDVLMWATLNEEMLAWVAALQDRGMRTAILSNMGEEMMRYVQQEFAWLQHFTHHTFSCALKIAKPDPRIYTYTCEKMGVAPGEALFIDDKPVNVEAAQAVGLHAVQFRNVPQLRLELEKLQLLPGWPLPGDAPVAQERVAADLDGMGTCSTISTLKP
jgi:putative hydrolase of the HAD superfamily